MATSICWKCKHAYAKQDAGCDFHKYKIPVFTKAEISVPKNNNLLIISVLNCKYFEYEDRRQGGKYEQ